MSCEDVQNQLSDYLNGALSAEQADAVEVHLAECPACQKTLGELRWVAGLLQGVPSVELPEGFGARIHSALDALEDEPVSAGKIPCDEAEDYLTGHLEGDLDDWEARALEGHLDGCADCRLALDQLRATRHLLHAVPREPMPDGLQGRIFAALEALDAPAPESCEEVRNELSDYLENNATDMARVAAHLDGCAPCREQRDQLLAVRTLLRAVPREEVPGDLAGRITAALAKEAGSAAEAPASKVVAFAPRKSRWSGWMSAVGGAAAAVAVFFIWNMQTATLPNIQTAAISTNTDVAVNIGFDVAQSVDGVTFQIDLPDGLKFVDDKSHPMQAQSVAWRGSLKEGKTVVPVVVRGVRPGRYEIEAYVSKGAMKKKTTIVLPVTGASS